MKRLVISTKLTQEYVCTLFIIPRSHISNAKSDVRLLCPRLTVSTILEKILNIVSWGIGTHTGLTVCGIYIILIQFNRADKVRVGVCGLDTRRKVA